MKKVSSNLLKQNCYLRDVTPVVDVPSSDTDLKYISLDVIQTENGQEIRETVNSYDITPERVLSYLDSTDYKTDPLSNLNLPARGFNLGDISAIQELLNDPERLRNSLELLSNLQKTSAESTSNSVTETESKEVPNE
ncbi:hypothetical protein [Dipodfec virus UOA04_Rod_715]|nr:hypothetical protein [Dipodfec virus UOA04_Rod_715]